VKNSKISSFCFLWIFADVVRRLTNYGQASPEGIVSVGQALREARQLLRDIKGRSLHSQSRAANHSFKYVNIKEN
jgi:hypothetical protein